MVVSYYEYPFPISADDLQMFTVCFLFRVFKLGKKDEHLKKVTDAFLLAY